MVANSEDRRQVERSFAARLIRADKIDQGALDRVQRIQSENRDRLDALLVKLGYVSERDAAETLAAELGLVTVKPADYPDSALLNGNAPLRARRHRQSRVLCLRSRRTRLLDPKKCCPRRCPTLRRSRAFSPYHPFISWVWSVSLSR
jgi:hypothetical protein